MIRDDRLVPLLKWPGGKTSELPAIHARLPTSCARYIEPFVGGGAVWFSVEAERYLVNDACHDLVELYRAVQRADPDLPAILRAFGAAWRAIAPAVAGISAGDWLMRGITAPDALADPAARLTTALTPLMTPPFERFSDHLPRALRDKARQCARLAAAGTTLDAAGRTALVETAAKSALYMTARDRLNNPCGLSAGARAAVFLIVRTHCYGAMFRYNARGAFNVPYGGLSYNANDLADAATAVSSPALRALLSRSAVSHGDFLDHLQAAIPTPDDFIFLDPPYDAPFNSYAGAAFGPTDQARLANYLTRECTARWMIVINDTPLIRRLYAAPDVRVSETLHTYGVSIRNRNDRTARHLIMTNYDVPTPE